MKGEKVYLSSKYSGCAEKYKGDLLSTSYTNDASAEIVYSEHQYDENGICTVCGDVKLVEPEKDINGVYLIADMHNLFWFANEVNNGNVNINAMLASDIVINRDVLDESGNLNSSLTNPKQILLHGRLSELQIIFTKVSSTEMVIQSVDCISMMKMLPMLDCSALMLVR